MAGFTLKISPVGAHDHMPLHACDVTSFLCCSGNLFIPTAGDQFFIPENERFQMSF
jgi:hypothetical protein